MRGRVAELGGWVPVEVKVPLDHPFRGAPAGAEQREVPILRPGRALHAELDEGFVERQSVKVAVDVAEHAVHLDDHEQGLGRRGGVVLVRGAGRDDPVPAIGASDRAGVEPGVSKRAGRRAVRSRRRRRSARHRAARRERRRDRGHHLRVARVRD